MTVGPLLERFAACGEQEAIGWQGQVVTYAWLLEQMAADRQWLAQRQIEPGSVVMLEADFSPRAVSMLLVLLERNCMLVPVSHQVASKKESWRDISQTEWRIRFDAQDQVEAFRRPVQAVHPFYAQLRKLNHAGLVLFSSGTTGTSKAAVHDVTKLMKKYRQQRHNYRTISFLLFDHIGGLDTLLYALSNGSCLITIRDRSPDAVCQAIETFRAEVLPVSPTFLKLFLLSEAYERYDLSSLKYITYGTEVMPEATLKKLNALFPQVKLLQKYGTTEVGTLRSKSRSSDSLWVKIGGEGYETRVVDGMLQIKAESAMLGYLNAPSPFTTDGWFMTGDAVEVDGEYVRIRGRKSEMINVGGEKVYPAEVEQVIEAMEGIAEVLVYGEAHALTGQIVCAVIRPLRPLSEKESRSYWMRQVRTHCRQQLEAFKIPVRITVTEEPLHSTRFKKMRKPGSS
ncbi:ANL family adenylate-forming protein [Marinicrinis sediminis]|uniref:Fatty acid--CoA ligase family protein n=1 Tax=Marinicrinis sediminis TaxID=1652465 RepID=A0ABW5R765_9BACL